MKLFQLWIFLFTLIWVTQLSAQIGNRYTAEEIKKQDAYLEAQVDIYMERYDLAINKLLKLYKTELGNSLYAFDLARTYHKLEDYPNAEKYAAIAVGKEIDNLAMLQFYAELMIQLERYEAAAGAFGQLVVKDSGDLSHIENHAKALINLGKTDEAIKVIDKWEEENFVFENLVRLKYQVYDQLGKKDKVEKELKKLVDFDPLNTRYLNNLATFYIQENKDSKAKEIFEKVLEIDPNNHKANTALYKLVATEQKNAPYLRSILPLIEQRDIDPDVKVLELIPFVNQLVDKPDKELESSLLQLSETMILIHPDNAKCMALRADILQIAGNKDQAIIAYEKTLAIDKKVYDVWQQLFYLLSDRQTYKKLGYWSFLALDYFPNKADNYYFYGMAMNEEGNPAEAIDYLQEGLLVAASNTVQRSKILSELARGYLLQENILEAEKYVDESLSLSKDSNPFALEVKGDVLAAQGKPLEALNLWKKAKKLGSNRPSLEKKLN